MRPRFRICDAHQAQGLKKSKFIKKSGQFSIYPHGFYVGVGASGFLARWDVLYKDTHMGARPWLGLLYNLVRL